MVQKGQSPRVPELRVSKSNSLRTLVSPLDQRTPLGVPGRQGHLAGASVSSPAGQRVREAISFSLQTNCPVSPKPAFSPHWRHKTPIPALPFFCLPLINRAIWKEVRITAVGQWEGSPGGEEPGPLPSGHPASLGRKRQSPSTSSHTEAEGPLPLVCPNTLLPFVHSATSLRGVLKSL